MGAVLSMLMPETVVDWRVSGDCRSRCRTGLVGALGRTRVVDPVHDWMPEPPASSLHVKFTPTSVLFQPFAFAAGVRLPVIVGLGVVEQVGRVAVSACHAAALRQCRALLRRDGDGLRAVASARGEVERPDGPVLAPMLCLLAGCERRRPGRTRCLLSVFTVSVRAVPLLRVRDVERRAGDVFSARRASPAPPAARAQSLNTGGTRSRSETGAARRRHGVSARSISLPPLVLTRRACRRSPASDDLVSPTRIRRRTFQI